MSTATPKQIVTSVYLDAKAYKQENGSWVIKNGSTVIGSGTNANKAWEDATHYHAPIQSPTRPPTKQGPVISVVSSKERDHRRLKNKLARKSRKQNRRSA